jgi:hypothetical protein
MSSSRTGSKRPIQPSGGPDGNSGPAAKTAATEVALVASQKVSRSNADADTSSSRSRAQAKASSAALNSVDARGLSKPGAGMKKQGPAAAKPAAKGARPASSKARAKAGAKARAGSSASAPAAAKSALYGWPLVRRALHRVIAPSAFGVATAYRSSISHTSPA